MIPEKSHDLVSLVIFCVIDKEDNAFNVVPFRICYKIAKMSSELYVSTTLKRVPHYAFARPEKCDKAVHSLCIAECCDVTSCSLFSPATFDFW